MHLSRSQDRLSQLFQTFKGRHCHEIPYPNARIEDIDLELFQQFHEKKYGIPFNGQVDELPQTFEDLNLASDGVLNLAGLLLFCKNPEKYSPLFKIIAVSFLGEVTSAAEYRDNENIEGNFKALFSGSLAFLKRNLRKIQKGQNFNSRGILEIPSQVLEELLVNALIHRDYFISSNIRVLIFDNRVEIINPGRLPDNFTEEKIKRGVSYKRNHTLTSFAFDLLPYRGTGSGIVRVLSLYPDIEFINDVETEQFKAIIKRPVQD